MSYASLARQIHAGQRKGIPEDEILEAVVRAIVPGIPLRSYLEGREELGLPLLRRILRSHFREQDATSVFQQLSTAVQAPKEAVHDFVIRTLDLKQKVLFASAESGATIQYEATQVHRMALRAISTGIQDPILQHELRQTLRQDDITDEALLEAVTRAVADEHERQLKLKPRQPKVSVVTDTTENMTPKVTPSTKPKPSNEAQHFDFKEFASSIKDMVQAEISALRAQSTESRASRRARGCDACQKVGAGDKCDHCFRCGGSDHYARGCRLGQKRTFQGNGNGLLGRDDQ